MSAVIVAPDQQLKEEISVWGQEVNSITIVDQETYNAMAGVVVELTRLEREIIAHHAPIKKATDAAHKAAVQAEKKMLAPVQLAKAAGSQKIVVWTNEQERLRRERERQAREEAERQARETQRLAELQAQEEQLQTAVQMEEQGSWPEDVEAVLNETVSIPVQSAPAPFTPRTFVPAPGISTSERWHAEIDSIKTLCAAIGSGDQPEVLAIGIEEYKSKTTGATWLSSPALNKMAGVMKTTMNIPGVRAATSTSTSVRPGQGGA